MLKFCFYGGCARVCFVYASLCLEAQLGYSPLLHCCFSCFYSLVRQDGGGDVGGGEDEMIYMEYLEAWGAVACYKKVNPYVPLYERMRQTFVDKVRSFCFAFLICTVGLCKRFLSPFRRLTFSTFVLLFLHSKQRTSICALPKSYFRRKRNLRWRARKRKRSSLERLQSIFG